MAQPAWTPGDQRQLWSGRADVAAHSITSLFGHRLLGMPGTHLAATVMPRSSWWQPRSYLAQAMSWNYWWQAHYLDAMIDAAWRSHDVGDGRAHARLGYARQLLYTVWLRNGLHITNGFFDDMAWLALAAQRLGALETVLHGRRTPVTVRTVDVLTRHISTADSPIGGLYWSVERDFVNVPATAPAAILWARHGDLTTAQQLIDWVYEHLYDSSTGLIMDGIRLGAAGQVIENAHYTYNQGTVLGALLAIGGDDNLRRASDLIGAMENHLTGDLGHRVLSTHGGHDGGLFTGILVRYLALAHGDSHLADSVRQCAGEMIIQTADALWATRLNWQESSGPATVFPLAPGEPAPRGRSLEMSPQLQAWMITEAAYRVSE